MRIGEPMKEYEVEEPERIKRDDEIDEFFRKVVEEEKEKEKVAV